MAGQVERQGFLQADQGRVVALVAGLGELVEGVVAALDVRGVVLAVAEEEPENAVVITFTRRIVSALEKAAENAFVTCLAVRLTLAVDTAGIEL